MKETLPPINKELLEKQIGDLAYNRTVDKVNAFLKYKGLEEEFLHFEVPRTSEIIAQLKSHEIPQIDHLTARRIEADARRTIRY